MLSRRRPRHEMHGTLSERERQELAGLRESTDALALRIDRLEEERDFYRKLLDPPEGSTETPPLGLEQGGADRDGLS